MCLQHLIHKQNLSTYLKLEVKESLIL